MPPAASNQDVPRTSNIITTEQPSQNSTWLNIYLLHLIKTQLSVENHCPTFSSSIPCHKSSNIWIVFPFLVGTPDSACVGTMPYLSCHQFLWWSHQKWAPCVLQSMPVYLEITFHQGDQSLDKFSKPTSSARESTREDDARTCLKRVPPTNDQWRITMPCLPVQLHYQG